MSNRNAWPHEMAQRAKDAGWRVTKPRGLTGAYKIWMPPCQKANCNHIMQVHLTSSDANAHRVVSRELNAHGLAGVEAKLAEKKANDKAARMEADRKAADAAATQHKALATAVNRAAGPYAGPEEVGFEWFVADHPAPWFRWVIMTPDLAKRILKELNVDNRKLNPNQVEHYAGIIERGDWKQTHQGCAIDRNKVLQDGQHRLEACVETGENIILPFFVGMDPDNWDAIDEGLNRTAAQLLGKLGESNAGQLSTMVKLIHVLPMGERARTEYRRKLTNEQIIRDFKGAEDELRRALVYGVRHAKSAHVHPAALGAAYFMVRAANGPASPYAAAFFRGLVSQRKLDERLALDREDARLKLVEYMRNARERNRRTSAFDQLCMTLLAWNYVSTGKRVKNNMRWTADSLIPRANTIAADSACPELLAGEIQSDEDTLVPLAAVA